MLIKITTRLDSTTVCRPPGLPQFARVGWAWMSIVLSSVKTCIKCRLPSSLFFFLTHAYFSVRVQLQPGSLNIGGVREKLDFVSASDAMVSKTDILDLLWHVSIKHVVFAKATFFPSWFYSPAHQLEHSDITFIEEYQNRSSISVFLPWRARRSTFNARHN